MGAISLIIFPGPVRSQIGFALNPTGYDPTPPFPGTRVILSVSEFLNLFNQVVPDLSETAGGANGPDNPVNSRTFGQIRGARAVRESRFALKFLW